jgi:hemolysin III
LTFPDALPKPRLRGVLHEVAFFVTVPLGLVLALLADGARARLAACVFAASVVAMLGVSALYHRRTWSAARHRWLRRLDHAGVYGLIAGTYTPFGLLVLGGAWRVAVLAIVWSGALTATLLKLVWVDAPKWLAVGVGIALGWVGVAAFPQLLHEIGIVAGALLAAGGLFYTAGAVVYALGRPDPSPRVFGYHEVFHAFTLVAVALQYAVVAFFVLPHGG